MRKPTDADIRLAPDNVQEYVTAIEAEKARLRDELEAAEARIGRIRAECMAWRALLGLDPRSVMLDSAIVPRLMEAVSSAIRTVDAAGDLTEKGRT